MSESTSGDGDDTPSDVSPEDAVPPRPSPSPAPAPASEPTARETTAPETTAELPVVAEPAPEPAPARLPAPERPSPGPRHAAPSDEHEGHPRRWFLAGAGAAVLAAAGGTGVALLRTDPEPTPNPAPATLLAAIATERALLADLDATTGGTPQVRQVLVQLRADHAAHLQALRGVAASYDPPSAASSSASRASGSPRSVRELRRAESRAASAATERAVGFDGGTATLLASIAACEACHAELLT